MQGFSLVPLVVLGGLIGLRAGQAARGKKIRHTFRMCRGGPSPVFFCVAFFGLFVVCGGAGFFPWCL